MCLANPLHEQLYKRVNATDQDCALEEWCRRFPDFPGDAAVQEVWVKTRASRHGRPLTALHDIRMKNPVLKFGKPSVGIVTKELKVSTTLLFLPSDAFPMLRSSA